MTYKYNKQQLQNSACQMRHLPQLHQSFISLSGGVKYKKLLRENTLYDHELQAATLYDHFAPVFFGIQVVPVISPPPHLVYLRRLYIIIINIIVIIPNSSKRKR